MKIIKWISDFLKKLNTDHVAEYTAQCAYYTFLSFIPFIILLLSLVKYVNIEKETLVYIFESILPSIMKNSVMDIIQEMYSKSIETISISAIFMLWSASNSFYALNKGISAIYKKEKEENYIFLRIKGIFGAVIALILIIAILIILVFGNSIEIAIKEHFPQLSKITDIIFAARGVISISLMFFIFLFMYRFTPTRKGKKLKNCVLGAIFTAIAWYAISFFFSIYVKLFTNFSIIYGSLATIIVIMMWLYSVIYAILLGAEINVSTEEKLEIWFEKLKYKKAISKILKDATYGQKD